MHTYTLTYWRSLGQDIWDSDGEIPAPSPVQWLAGHDVLRTTPRNSVLSWGLCAKASHPWSSLAYDLLSVHSRLAPTAHQSRALGNRLLDPRPKSLPSLQGFCPWRQEPQGLTAEGGAVGRGAAAVPPTLLPAGGSPRSRGERTLRVTVTAVSREALSQCCFSDLQSLYPSSGWGYKVGKISRVRLFVIPWTVAHKTPLSTGFPRQEYWSRQPFPSPGEFPNPGIEPTPLGAPTLAGKFFYPFATWEALRYFMSTK